MIHQFDGNRWLPGSPRRDGAHPFPLHARRGDCFNDVTGAIGPSVAAVAETLQDLFMKQGVYQGLLPTPIDWKRLSMDIWLYSMKDSHVDGLPRRMADVIVHPDESLQVLANDPWPMPLAERSARLAMALVCANGQFDYIRRQDWFRQGRHEVVLEVESVVGRQTPHLVWHKDTQGQALFSNLLFRNEAGLPSPEWSMDLEPMSAEKRELLESQWPSALLQDLDATRAQRVAALSGTPLIEGGVLGQDGFVSWVDELVWHSSPWLKHRDHWTLDEAMDALLGERFDLAVYDVLAHMAQTPSSRLSQWMVAHHRPLEAFGYEQAQALWHDSRTGADSADLMAAFRADLRSIDWLQCPFDTAVGMSLIRDRADSEAQDISFQPTGMLGRPRRNSEQMPRPTPQQRDFLQVIVAVRPRQ